MADETLKFSDFENSDKFKDAHEKKFLESVFQGVLQYAKEQDISLERFVILTEIMAVRIRDAYQQLEGEK